jgi:ketopantoate reductase
MRVAIYGTGGAGGYFGAQLARTDEDVTFIARGQHLKAIQVRGLCVDHQLRRKLTKPNRPRLRKILPREVGCLLNYIGQTGGRGLELSIR